MSRTRRASLIAASIAASVALVSCAPPHQQDSAEKVDTANKVAVSTSSGTASSAARSEAEAPAEAVTFKDGYVKAKPGDTKMTAIFGTLVNNTDKPITVVSFNTNLYAGMYQIHEVVDGVMRERKGGITLAPGESHVLEPGGDHFMIMDLPHPIQAGDVVQMQLVLSDGTGIDIPDLPVRTINSGEENYGEGGELQSGAKESMEKHDHGDHGKDGGHEHGGHSHKG